MQRGVELVSGCSVQTVAMLGLSLRGLQVLLLLGIARHAGGQNARCKVEENVGYHGPNLDLPPFPNSNAIGCARRDNAQQCCELCASYWPQCISWAFVKNGNNDNGLAGLNGHCCLKGSFRPDAESTSNCCDSGYQNPRCYLTADCKVNLYGQDLAAGNSMVILQEGEDCGSGNKQDWIGITNPATVTTNAPFREYDFGKALSGDVGDYRLCYKSAAGTASQHTTTVGGLTMRGPESGQAHSCMLGLACEVVLNGVDFPENPATYKLLIVLKSSSANPCPTGGPFTGELISFVGMKAIPRPVEDGAEDNKYILGDPVPKSGNTVAEYGLCWASSGATNADYTVYVGTFTVGGPTVRTLTCTMGTLCQIDLVGRDFASTNAVVILVGVVPAVCGFLYSPFAFHTGFTNPLEMVAGAPYTTYTFGTALAAHQHTPGSGYRLCWTSARRNANPYDRTNYDIDAGTFTLHGPNTNTEKQCTFTTNCTLTLQGSGLSDVIPYYGVLVILQEETCGNANARLPSIQGTTWKNPANVTRSTTVQFGVPTVGRAAVYKACWGPEASTYSQYNVTLGTFTLGGPGEPASGDTTVQCTKGVDCVILLSGEITWFAGTNKVLIIDGDSCGTSSPTLAVFSPMVSEKTVNQDGIHREYQMGLPNSGIAKQGYTLCWGADPLNHAEFSFKVGRFDMIGANVAPRNCTLGLACILNLSGFGLSATNRIIVLRNGQCGDNQPGLAQFVGLQSSKAVEEVAPYSEYNLGTPIAGPPGNNFKVCWTHATIRNGVDLARAYNIYKVTVGEPLTVNGPTQGPHDCTMSMSCSVQLTGTGLASSNKVLIIESSSGCGQENPTVASFPGLQNPKQAEATVVGRFDLGIPGEGTPGTAYSICWAHNPTSLADYRVTLGVFTMSGPNEDDVVHCTYGLSCVATVTGHGLASTNELIIAALSDDCGQAALNLPPITGLTNPATIDANLRTFPLGLPTAGQPGDYTICWGHDTNAHGDYHVKVAVLRMAGPVPADKSCTMSEPCQIPMAGVRLAHASRVLVIKRTFQCGDPDATSVAVWPGFVNYALSIQEPPANPGYVYSNGDTYNAGEPYGGDPGATYRICWAFDPPGAEGPAAYRVPVGLFDMNGPVQGVVVRCTLGQACNMALTGWGLASTNRALIVTGPGACGANTLVSAVLQGIDNPKLVTDDAYDNSYALGLVTVGGSYAACRVSNPAETCIGNHYKLCWAHGVYRNDDQYNFKVEIGTFAMSGPFVTYATECLLGAVCAFRIYGSEFKASNRVLLVEERGACGDADPPVAAVAGFTNPQKVAEVSADGKYATFRLGRSDGSRVASYRLCWGFDPLLLFHYNIEVGPFYLKELPENCEILDGMTATCTVPPSS